MLHFRVFLFLLILLSANNFYNPFGLVSSKLSKLLFYGLTIFALFYGSKAKKSTPIGFPKKTYRMILFGILFSAVMAGTYQAQGFGISVMAVFPYFFAYLTFYVLVKMQLSQKEILQVFGIVLLITTFVYVVNYITFPHMIFGGIDATDSNTDYESRGVIRVRLPYMELYLLGVFYSINQWFLNNKKKWLLGGCFCFLMVVLSVTRQYILWSLILGGWLLINKVSLFKKGLFVAVAFIVYLFVLPHLSIYQGLSSTTEEQISAGQNEDDIRIREYYFYGDDFQTNAMTRVFGNGVPSMGNSKWGNDFEYILEYTHLYASDVGWVGLYWYFGIFTVLGVAFLLIRGVFLYKEKENTYQTYICLALILLSFTSGPILISRQIASVMTILYLVYSTYDKRLKK